MYKPALTTQKTSKSDKKPAIKLKRRHQQSVFQTTFMTELDQNASDAYHFNDIDWISSFIDRK